MDRATVLQLQQIEFFLLHNLVVDELRVLKRSKRVTPTHRSGGTTARQRMALTGRLFRSFLEKVFRRPFSVSKRPYWQEFMVVVDSETQDRLRRINTVQPDLCRTLQPNAEEVGLIRFDFPRCLTVSIASSRRRGYYYDRHSEVEPNEMGIGRHCPAAKAVLAWRGRLDAVLSAGEEEMVGPPEPTRNQAQEQLEAVLREAVETGRL